MSRRRAILLFFSALSNRLKQAGKIGQRRVAKSTAPALWTALWNFHIFAARQNSPPTFPPAVTRPFREKSEKIDPETSIPRLCFVQWKIQTRKVTRKLNKIKKIMSLVRNYREK